MNEKDNFEFNFDEKYEDIIAAMQKKQEEEYEDIVSDTSFKNGKPQFEDISSTSDNRYKRNQRKGFKAWWNRLTRGKKAALISVTSVVLVVAIVLGWFFSYFKYNYNSITTDPGKLGFTDVKQKGVINIALFGVDSRDENVFKGNTDSIMILSLNTNTKKVKIFSVMRDTFVPMEYEGESYFGKINSAYSKGPEHAIKTLNTIFDLDISEYATVNFYGMVDIIDAVGGIPATITEDELSWKGSNHPNLNNCMDEICNELGLDAKDYYIHTAGEQTLNGVQAVAYSRVRYCRSVWGTNNDYGRTDRQRHVMQGLFNKAITMKKSQYVTLAKALIPCSETSLSYSDIIGLATNILLSSPTFEQYRLPQDNFTMTFTGPSRYGSVVYYDLDYAAKLVNAIIYDDVTMEQYIESNPVEKNDWYSDMASSDTSGRNSSSTVTSSQTTTSSEQTTVISEPEDTSVQQDVSSEEDTSSDEDTSSVEDTSSEEDPTESTDSSTEQTPTQSTDSSSSDTTSEGNQSEKTDGDTTSTPSVPETSSESTTP